MNDLLRDTMNHKADHVEEPALDVAAMISGGTKIRRRRRVLQGTAVAAFALVAGGVAVPLLTGDGGNDQNTTVASGDGLTVAPLYSNGSSIYIQGEPFDTGHDIRAFVPAGDDFVIQDAEGVIWAWSVGGTDERLGEAATPDQPLDSDGTVAGWVDVSGPATAMSYGPDGAQSVTPAAEVGRVDPDFVRVADGIVYYSIGSQILSSEGPVGPFPGVVADLAAGKVATSDEDESLVVYDESAEDGTTLPMRGDFAMLSPDGQHVFAENSDDFKAFRIADQTEVTPTTKADYEFMSGYEWLDDVSYLAMGINGIEDGTAPDSQYEVTLLVCSVTTLECTALESPGLGTFPEFRLPAGFAFE